MGGVAAGIWNEDTLSSISIIENQPELFYYLTQKNFWQDDISDHKFGVFLSHGLHPMLVHEKWLDDNGTINTKNLNDDCVAFKKILQENSDYIVAIGESGFDLSKDVLGAEKCKNLNKQKILELQNFAFEVCVQSSVEFSLPLILHLRGNWDLALQKIRWALKQGVPRLMIHCYSGPASVLKTLAELRVYCSFGGVPTWKGAHKNRHALSCCERDFLLMETDSPDLPPEFLDGSKPQKNEPVLLLEIAKQLSQQLNLELYQYVKQCNRNLLTFLFGI